MVVPVGYCHLLCAKKFDYRFHIGRLNRRHFSETRWVVFVDGQGESSQLFWTIRQFSPPCNLCFQTKHISIRLLAILKSVHELSEINITFTEEHVNVMYLIKQVKVLQLTIFVCLVPCVLHREWLNRWKNNFF